MKDHEKWYRGEESTSQKFLNTNNWSNKFFTQNQYEISELQLPESAYIIYENLWMITGQSQSKYHLQSFILWITY